MSVKQVVGVTAIRAAILEVPESAGGLSSYADQKLDYDGKEGVVLAMIRKAWLPDTYPLFFFGCVDHVSKNAPHTLITASAALSIIKSTTFIGKRAREVALEIEREATKAMNEGDWP